VRRLLIIFAAFLLLGAPAAAAKPGKADRREAQKECRAERGTTDATREAFRAKYRNFGDCVSQTAREAKAERKQAKRKATRECRDEGLRGKAFGKCVSQKAKAERAAQDAADAEAAENRKNAAQECDTERGDTAQSRQAFADKYGTNANKRNAFGKCVSQKVRSARSSCAGRGVPTSKISIQLWTFADYIGFGTDAATIARTEEVLRRLSEMGYRNVEPFTLSGLSAEQYKALLDKYGLKASARHVDVGRPEAPSDFDQILADNKTLGIKYFGSGATPIFPPVVYTTEAEWVAYARYLNELGARARQAGQTLMVHNHDVEFEQTFGDQTVYDILMANTDPKNVVFQLDIYWATNGGGLDNPVNVLERYGNRIQLFHVKDMAAGPFPGPIEIVGEGIIDFPMIFAASKGPARYYVVEHDPRFGDPTFDPFEAAEKGFAYLDCVRY
jgi:sugar phosphate isomerase/epimerase